MKICNTCRKEKPLNKFYKKHGSKDGLEYCCKECISIRNRAAYEDKHNSKRIKPKNKNNKFCYTCKTEKPKTEFYKDKYALDGLRTKCKSCNCNTEKTKASNKKYMKKYYSTE